MEAPSTPTPEARNLGALARLAVAKPEWFDSALPGARRVAEQIPLVRVAVSASREAAELRDVLRTGLLRASHKSARSREIEVRLGAQDFLYFHAGRTHPAYGKVVFALGDAPDGRYSEASPSGLGGLFCADGRSPDDASSHFDGSCLAPVSHRSDEDQRSFYEQSVWAPMWRSRLGDYLAAYYGRRGLHRYFASEEGSRPDQDDPAGVFHNPSVKDWRAWTVEVRVAGDVDLNAMIDAGKLLWWGVSLQLRRDIEKRMAAGEEFPLYERLRMSVSDRELDATMRPTTSLLRMSDVRVVEQVGL